MPAAKKPKAAAPVKSAAVRIVAGSDEAEVKRRAAALAEEMAGPDAGEFGRDVIDGAADNAGDAATRIHDTRQALLTLPFFGGDKLVWLKNANFLADTVLGRAAAVTDALEALQETLSQGLPAGVKFLMSAIDADKRRTFYKALGKLGEIEVFDKVDTSRGGWEEAAGSMIESRCRQRGLRMSGDAVELLALLTGGDSRQVDNELEKIDLYVGKERREATAEDVRTLVPLTREGVVFELGNALAARQTSRCFELMEQLLKQGENAVGILLVAIIPTVRSLLLVKDLMQRHRLSPPQQPWFFGGTLNKLPAEATDHLPRKKDGSINAFVLGLAAVHARRFELDELRALLEACLTANVRLVTSGLDERVVLAELIGRVAKRA
ncbi:MAG TPA: DNA polymerase III subunit delta [Chthoniobacteraceae bacterium]|jgi:DNA polymerase-3 subunit delta|nr:DNA polymerase III subunit delta [Chthoniobacteraceae bacterium]